MKRFFSDILLLCLLLILAGVGLEAYAGGEGFLAASPSRFFASSASTAKTQGESSAEARVVPLQPDTVAPRFPVKHTTSPYLDENEKETMDLRDPENLKTQAVYDEELGVYKFGTQLGNYFLEAPYHLTPQEYMDWTMKRSMNAYYRQKNAEAFEEAGKEKFDFTNLQFDLGPMDKVFGPGGVQIKTQGSAELKVGATMRNTDNPSLSERNRKVFGFDFDETINLSLTGSVGDKMNMDFNYNSEATFDFDSQNLKLTYEGKEDEIIKLLEGGNVSFPTNNSLIQGATSLFGVRADMQFGKLKLQTVISQKKSSSTTVSSKGGTQLSTFEITADAYDENRHFFLAHFFRDKYDASMKQLPTITSGISITKIEIWVTNKTGTTTNTRDIVAFADLGEYDHISNSMWDRSSDENPSNSSNSEYGILNTLYSDARDISLTTSTLDGAGLEGGVDYEKLESARKLTSSEYTLNSSLGYVSLKSTLQTDQVLAVAYEYTYKGTTYQVGEFASDIQDNTSALFVKALRNTSCTPDQPNWDLMMKNVYSLGATSVEEEKFKLDIKLLSDTTGVYISYIPEENFKDQKILKLLGLDRLNNNNKVGSNGYFDFVEDYTIDTSTGRIYFPLVEPFGEGLATALGDETLAEKYVYQELYDSTRTVAKQYTEKNKFILTGQYKANRTGEINLGSTNIPRGSVTVTAGGTTLTEGTDYTVDYSSGIVTILNTSILDAGTSVSVSLESDTDYGMVRKTMLGLNWEYDFSDNFQIGGTIMHLGEKALTTKVSMGNEPLNNTLWGLNLSWKKQSQRLTDWLNKLPFLNCTTPSSINFSAEFAQLIAGKSKGVQGNASYIDDFEDTQSDIDISTPSEWTICSTPSMFSEASLSNDVRYGYNRALLAWYYIDPLFTRRSSSLTPSHIKNDLEQLSDPDVREVYKSELFPNSSINMRESNTLSVLNLAFYPEERGPYNLDTQLDEDGHLLYPEQRWGGMMRKLDTSDFETANIGYIEFWLLDPFIKSRENGTTPSEGDLYFNLGEISEDILKDGKKFYESGLPIDGDESDYTETVWGKVPSTSSVTYSFNTSSGSRSKQDVGYNGLTSEEEQTFGAYKTFLDAVQSKVRSEVYDSLLLSPSADLYHYFRGTDYDLLQKSILDRYKYINNPNGNSVDSDNSPESYSTAYKTTPDVEDINQDYTLNEYEKYFQYHVRIAEDAMEVGQNYIVDKRETSQKTRDGITRDYTWYQFRIPVDEYESVQGSISDFSSIRFMRIFMTGFEQERVLRFATLNLVHGEWREYEQALYSGEAPDVSGTITVSAVNFEENNEKEPVNYVIPPGISRVVDSSQDQILQDNEQALALTVENLASGDARAVYKGTSLDLRRYKHLQMFAHANSLAGSTEVEDGQVSIFLRMGSDYRSNFYEYEVPLTVTPEGKYSNSESGALLVWPEENMIDIDLSLLTDVKKNRNAQKSLGLASYTTAYSEYDPDNEANKVTVMGNPTLGEVKALMIGVRNNSRTVQDIEVWANELRLQNPTSSGGWAAKGQLNLQLSDVATVDVTGHIETEGFGGLEESVTDRRDDNLYEYSITTNIQAGKFLPEKVKLNAPIYFSYSRSLTVPKYNPLDTDQLLSEALDALSTKAERDSLKKIAQTVEIDKNFSISGARFNISTKNHPMPYDPANFTFGYAHSSNYVSGETTEWEKDLSWKWSFDYSYSPNIKAFEPFKKSKNKSEWFKILKDQSINFVPQSISFSSVITRTYYEYQERDIESEENDLPLTWSSDFLWNRSFSLRWDFTKNLHFSFSSGTNAEIEQPYTPVNKELYPDRYSAWKDSVRTSLLHLGSPLSYNQTFDASWKLPLNKIPIFDWLTTDVSYNATYSWTRGSELDDGTSMGHTLTNSRKISGNAKANLESLYNHVPFLKKVNRKYSQTPKEKGKDDKDKKFQAEVELKPDTTFSIKHGQKSKKLKVTAIRADGSRYPIRYKVIDNNNIQILSQDTARLKLTVSPRKRTEDQGWYKALQFTTRLLMMVRSVNVSYTNNYNLSLPGFLPEVGDLLGQRSMASGGFAPGLDFAFGLTDESYIERAAEKGWLLMSDSIVTPATTAFNESITLRATLEPIKDLKIDLNATRTRTRSRSIQYMYDGMPTTETGSFSMTTISINTAFEKTGSADKGYPSKAFDKFVASLDAYQQRVEALFTDAPYPSSSTLAGTTFDPENGTISSYASEVMIPAFLNAYTVGGGSSLSIFPALTKLLPNWSVTYSGLAKLPRMKKLFKSFTLTHAYKSVYSVGSYSSYSTFQEYMGIYGFVTDVSTSMPVPSSMYDVSTVSINESFSPLIGLDMTFLNNLSAKFEVKKTRVLTLSMTSQQITETRSKDYVLGLGYKIADLNLFQPKRTVRSKASKSNQKEASADQTTSKGFSNDMNLRFDFTFRDQATLCRDIITQSSEATSGTKTVSISISADYALSKLLTLTAYYDRQLTKPLLTSSSYPVTTQDFGVSIKFILNH